jgi:hypothetical protein
VIYDIVDFFVGPIMWLVFSQEGREWMPFILFIVGLWSVLLALWLWWPSKPNRPV